MLTGIAKRYYYDDHRIALQTSVSSGGTETDYRYFVYGNYIDEVLMMRRITPAADFYYGHDHLYSPTALFNSSGTIAEAYEYDAYGSVRIFGAGTDGIYFTADDQLRSVSSVFLANPYTFTGREIDSFDNNTLKIMYYRARSYDPQTGRFLQRDQLGVDPSGGLINKYDVLKQYFDGTNIYEYVKSNPVILLDPSGLCKYCDPENRKGFDCGLASAGWQVFPLIQICERKINTSDMTDRERHVVEAYGLQHTAIVREGLPAIGLYPGKDLPSNEKDNNWTNCYPVYRRTCSFDKNCGMHDNVLRNKVTVRARTHRQPYDEFTYNCSSWAADTINAIPCLCTTYKPTDWRDVVTDPDAWKDLLEIIRKKYDI
jgi:RHS repeat-associated protein